MAAWAAKQQRGAAGLGPCRALGSTRFRGFGSLAVGTARAFVPMRTIRPANRAAVLLVVLRDHPVGSGNTVSIARATAGWLAEVEHKSGLLVAK